MRPLWGDRLITGQRPLTHGVFMNDVQLNPNARSLGKVLKENGYETGYIGKWHIDGRGRSKYIPPERQLVMSLSRVSTT